MKQILFLNPENITEEEAKSFRVRRSPRAVLINKNGKIAISYVKKYDCYKIPGGGAKENETDLDALARECTEEAGCEIEIVREIGEVIEWRRMHNLVQISPCYFAKVKKKLPERNLTIHEKESGFELLWVSFEEALHLIQNSNPKDLEYKKYIKPRELKILEECEFI
ncbi:MAG: hypothetical protein Fur0024_4670 [Patescibacteria group bacterium]